MASFTASASTVSVARPALFLKPTVSVSFPVLGLPPMNKRKGGVRCSTKRHICQTLCRFLKDEWNFLNQDDDYSSNLPISEKLWRNLPRRISEADIKVPQQKNDFDCGPFVLFFIERFIEEAPQRLKRKDLGMFDKKWFKPATPLL